MWLSLSTFTQCFDSRFSTHPTFNSNVSPDYAEHLSPALITSVGSGFFRQDDVLIAKLEGNLRDG